MTLPQDTAITVDAIIGPDIHLSIGPSSYVVDKSELSALMAGTLDDIETLKCNIALALAVDGVDIADDVVLKNAIEGRRFKAFR